MSRRVAVAGYLGLVAAFGLLVTVRIVAFGWSGIAPDDARYLYVGLSMLDGHGPLTPDGNVFLLRSPVYSLVLALGAGLTPTDALVGAHLAATALAVVAFALAVALGWRLGGPAAATGVAVALAATPLLWGLIPTLRIDVAQATGVVAVLIVIARPTPRRWLMAGLLLGLTVLIKESALPLVLLPGAFIGTIAWRRLAVLTTAYLGAAVVVAGWWWVVVWRETGLIFPANALAVIERRQVGTDLSIGRVGAVLLVIVVVGWLVAAVGARRDARLRPLLLAGLLLALPALYSTLNGLDTRNYTPLAVLSAVAVGLTGADLVRRLRSRTALAVAGPMCVVARPGAAANGGVAAHSGRLARLAVPLAALAVAVAALGSAQVVAPVASRPPLPDLLAGWLRTHTALGERIVMTFRYRALEALLLYGRNEVAEVRPQVVRPTDDPSAFVWLGLRDRQLFGYSRQAWTDGLDATGTRVLGIVTPHYFSPPELVAVLGEGIAGVGLSPVATLTPGGPEVALFVVDPAAVSAASDRLPLVMQADAATAWLDLAASDPTASARLAAASPIIVATPVELGRLLDRLGAAACSVPANGLDPTIVDSAASAIELRPTGTCP